LAGELGIDWEQLDAGTKKDKTRSLLLYLYRRNRIADLLHTIQAEAQGSGERGSRGDV
jgi:hypothetical protein